MLKEINLQMAETADCVMTGIHLTDTCLAPAHISSQTHSVKGWTPPEAGGGGLGTPSAW